MSAVHSVVADLPAESTPRSASSRLEAQKLASRRIGFSVTQACPLRCAHCSVQADPALSKTTFTEAFGHKVAEQLAGLHAMGIRFLDFTGGEPTLARRFVQVVSAESERLGISCGIVTAAHWANTPSMAETYLGHFPDIHNWDISTDLYHQKFVPFSNVINAFNAIQARGDSAQLRIAYHEPMLLEDAHLIREAFQSVGRKISFQPIGPVGRGKVVTSVESVDRSRRDPMPCPSTGLLVRSDGAGAPCCAPVSHESSDSPLFVGNAFRDDLASMVDRWRHQPLLQTIRLWGFEYLDRWIEPKDGPSSNYRERVCDECVAQFSDPAVVWHLNSRANELQHRIDLAVALKREYGEPWMEQKLVREAESHLAGQVDVWS